MTCAKAECHRILKYFGPIDTVTSTAAHNCQRNFL